MVNIKDAITFKSMFRFSYDKHFGGWSYEDFMMRANLLEKIVKETRHDIESKILTCEDKNTYNWSTVSFAMDEVRDNLSNRKEYNLQNIDKSIWSRSLDVSHFMNIPNDKNYFMINLSLDKVAEKNRLMFYGQGVDEETLQNIGNKFYKTNRLVYSLGDGFPKTSDFNMGIAYSHISSR